MSYVTNPVLGQIRFNEPSSTSGSACSMCCSSTVTSSPQGLYWAPLNEIYIPQSDILTEIQRKAFTRTMQKHKDGFELLAK